MKNIIDAFNKLAFIVKNKWEITYGTNEIEPELLNILDFVKKNIAYRMEIANCFIDIINDYTKGPLEIVVFCMRELQWQEVKEAAGSRQISHKDPRVKFAMQKILDVYEREWNDADLYHYYSNSTNNSEPY